VKPPPLPYIINHKLDKVYNKCKIAMAMAMHLKTFLTHNFPYKKRPIPNLRAEFGPLKNAKHFWHAFSPNIGQTFFTKKNAKKRHPLKTVRSLD
jgi:hypothetical protein